MLRLKLPLIYHKTHTINLYWKLFQRKQNQTCITNEANNVNSVLENPAYNPYHWQECHAVVTQTLNSYDEAITDSPTLGLFAFKSCDTHSLQHDKQRQSFFKKEGKLSRRGQSALFLRVLLIYSCFCKCIQQKVLFTIQTDMQHICGFYRLFI